MSTKRSQAHQHLVAMQQAHRHVLKLLQAPSSEGVHESLGWAAVVIYHLHGWNRYKQTKGLPVKWYRTKGMVTLRLDDPKVGEVDDDKTNET